MKRLVLRTILFGGLAFLAASLAAPQIKLDSFRERVRGALQNSLHRKVTIGEVTLSLLTGPGFSINDVVIHEDPGAGLEPFAYVSTLDARIGISTLWTGRLQFSTLTLDEPSVNLVKPANGPWNVILLQNTMQAGGGTGKSGAPIAESIPTIKIRSGRLNFKFGDVKSPFYFTDASVDIWPSNSTPGSFEIRFSGDPARTDRTAQGFGTLNGRGRFRRGTKEESVLDLYLELEKSRIDEMAQLFRGHDFGLHGLVSSHATVQGPLSNLQIAGLMQLEDVHRWDLLPSAKAGGALAVNYRGKANWLTQTLDLWTNKKENPNLPFLLRAHLFDYLSQPRWAADVTLEQLPASSILEIARHMGAPLPAELTVSGKVVGVVGYGSASGLQGQVALEDTSLKMGTESHLDMAQATVSLDGNHIRLAPADIAGSDAQSAQLEADYDVAMREFDVVVRARALNIVELQPGSGNLFATASLPVMEHFASGSWSGTMQYTLKADAPGVWSGDFQVRNAEARIPGLAFPLMITVADASIEGARVVVSRLRARAGRVAVDGEYRYEPDDLRPHRFKLSSAAVDVADLEKLFLPTLRRDQSFLARTLRFKSGPAPAWLRTRRADGTFRIGKLITGPLEWANVRGRAIWDGTAIDLTGLESKLEDGVVTGRVQLDLAAPQPKYKLKGQVQNAAFHNGHVDVETALESRGTGTDFLTNLKAEGTFQARSVSVVPDTPFGSASGTYEFWISPLGPKLRLAALQASAGAEKFQGQAETAADGRLQLELGSPTRTLRTSLELK